MAASVVIKVKFGDTLRRFNAQVNEDQHLNLNMEEMRAKIRALFNFPLDAGFVLTYVDEDEDKVTLVDDEDLFDIMRQGLNPIRITVHSTATKGTSSGTRSKSIESSTPNVSSTQTLAQDVNQNVAEVLKTVPEPLRGALSKLSGDLASKAASTSPFVAELIDNLSKVGQSILNSPRPHLHRSSTMGSHDEGCNNVETASQSSTNEGMKADGIGSVGPASKSTQAPNAAEGAKPMRLPLFPPDMLQRHKDAAEGAKSMRLPLFPPDMLQRHKDATVQHSDIKSGINGSGPVKTKVCGERQLKDKGISGMLNGQQANKHFAYPKKYTGATVYHRFDGSSSKSALDSPTGGECPFTGSPLYPRYIEGTFGPSPVQPSNDGMGSIFHKGVRCDGCGALPITGPRYKSKVKHDFDLCCICFSRMGNDSDYTRIDFALPYRHPQSFKGPYDPVVSRPNVHVQPPFFVRPHVGKHLRSRLDSRFIMDVNVMDGTMMAPSTPFTKIWRMRNNGTLPWSHGLQLIWIGGDRFSSSDSVNLEIPEDGVDIGNELDVAVDFIAPELPGRYVSYWRMAEPSGHKFGQRVWVLIQVDASLKESTRESSPGLNLNLPPQNTGILDSSVPDVNTEQPLLDVSAGGPNSAQEAENSPIVEQKHKLELADLNILVNDDLVNLVVDDDVSCAASSVGTISVSPSVHSKDPVFPVTSSVSYPEVDSNVQSTSAPPSPSCPIINTETISKESSANSSNAEDEKWNQEQDKEKKEFEESMLKELEQMGFKQVGLNKEVLRMNEYDLELSVDDLCGVSEWDPMLEELQEMGFHDKETNKKLLAKNNGSITRVVLDLIAGERA